MAASDNRSSNHFLPMAVNRKRQPRTHERRPRSMVRAINPPSDIGISNDDGNTNANVEQSTNHFTRGINNNMGRRPHSAYTRYRSNSRQRRQSDAPPLPTSVEEIWWNEEQLHQITIPDAREEHEKLIAQYKSQRDENDEESTVKQAICKELEDQLETFNVMIESLSAYSPSTLEDAQNRLQKFNREIKRIKAHLPIYAERDNLLEAIQSNRVVILKAETGSGKSTQLVQYLVDGGLADRGQIICTQPRRLAARTLSSRVAEEFGCRIGEEIGYHVGSSAPRVSDKTRVRFVTDAILLNEYHDDPLLSAYSVVIIDEAHERKIDTDLLFGIMKICMQQRKDIRLIIMSATLDEGLLCNYYKGARLIKVPGRTYPIEDEYAVDDPEDYIDAAIKKTLEIHQSREAGDILVFLTGPDEINQAIEEVKKKLDPKHPARLLPLHGKLDEKETQDVFESTNGNQRKIIFATNVAEMSITIDGIRHVIDSGMVKEVMWDAKRNMRALKIGFTTQSSVKQRRGRAGRTSPGKCYHLYTFETYLSFDVCSRPEILCIQPSIAVLKLKYLNAVEDVSKFDWLEAPSTQSLRDATVGLKWLGALDERTEKLTDLGYTMAKLGLDPMLSAMILAGKTHHCLQYVLALAGMLNVVQNIWWRGKDEHGKQLEKEKRVLFTHDSGVGGDHIALLRVFIEWNAIDEGRDKRNTWCRDNMVNGKSLKMAQDFIREVAYRIDPKYKLKFDRLDDELIKKIICCVCAGYFQNLAISNGSLRAGYQLVNCPSTSFTRIHRSSVLMLTQETPQFILYHDILIINETNYLTAACPVELTWLNKTWLDSLPRSPSESVLKSIVLENLGPALLLSIVGKKCCKVSQIEQSFGISLNVDYEKSQLTIWGKPNELQKAKDNFEQLLRREREKLRTEVEEFEIIGSTRVLLGAGARIQLTMVQDEYAKVLVTRLPSTVTEVEIERKFRPYGEIQNIAMLQANATGRSAMITYCTCESAQTAVKQLTHEIWDGREINVAPSHVRTSVHPGRQNCKLKAYWFMTESKGHGGIHFSDEIAAIQAKTLLERRYHARIQFCTNLPTIKCTWPLQPHNGKGTIYYQTAQEVQQALKSPFIVLFSPRMGPNPLSLWINNVRPDYDEDDLKAIFQGCQSVVLLRGPKGIVYKKPPGVEDELRRLFNGYSSFQRDSVTVMLQGKSGRMEGYVQFTDEQQMQDAISQMNNKSNLIGAGKLRLCIDNQQKTKLGNTASKSNEENHTRSFVVKLSKLPLDVDEESLTRELHRMKLSNYVSEVYVARKPLPRAAAKTSSESASKESEMNIVKLQSLFTDRHSFISAPDIQIRPATNDGRVIAFIFFNDPRDVTTAIEKYTATNDSSLLRFGQFQLRLVPILDHDIELNAALTKAIPNKIEDAVKRIENDPQFSNITLIKKVAVKNNSEIIRLSIKGSNIQEIYRARTVFDDLMRGEIFKFQEPSWVSVIFSESGKKFLQNLQQQTGSYIWWNWKSNLLRIFGENGITHHVIGQIKVYIQQTIQNESSITIPIPAGCVRQCLQASNEFRKLANSQVDITVNVVKRSICIRGNKSIVHEYEHQVRDIMRKCESALVSSKARECPICMCEFDASYTLQQCGHTFCRVCLISHFKTYFDSSKSFNDFNICCPGERCQIECCIRDITAILGFEDTAKLARIAFKVYIRNQDNGLVQCLGYNCDQVYRPLKSSSIHYCDQCTKMFCVPCEAEYHYGIECDEYRRQVIKKNEALLTTNLGSLPYRRCPRCKVPIEKTDGCNAMKCSSCCVAFCWRCSFMDEKDVHFHFADQTSSCYNNCFDLDDN